MADISVAKSLKNDLLAGQKAIFLSWNDATSAGSGHVDTGLKLVSYAFVSNTKNANAVKLEKNTDSAGVKNGSIKITCTAGDTGDIVAIGI